MSGKDITNQVFGRLTALSLAAGRKRGMLSWNCRCSCGQECVVRGDHLRSGRTQSCGCLHREAWQQRYANRAAKRGELRLGNGLLRDLFAGFALVGLIAQSDKQMSVLRLAEESYKCADAMLKARTETETNNAI